MDIATQRQHTFPIWAESSKEASPKQDKAGAPEKRHLPKLPSDWPAEADPDKQGFLQLSSLSHCPCQCSNCNKVKTDGREGGGVVSSSFTGQHLKDTSESPVPLQLNQHSLLIWLRLKIAIPGASPQ